MPRPVILVIGGLVVLGLALALVGRCAAPEPAAIEIGSPSPAPTPPPTLLVDVAGAVARPGVVQLTAGARIGDAIAAAGGALPQADLVAVNRAAPVRDGDRVYLPRKGEIPPVTAAGTGDTRIDLNRATAVELQTLPGVGPATAARIVRARQLRPFTRVEDLQTRGLVPARMFAELRPLAVVR